MLVEPAADAGCEVNVNTAAHGFGEVWRAVCEDFFARHDATLLGGVRFSVNDAGATPAVVSLRLDQALREFRSSTPPGGAGQ